jgi:hypothetical protein
MGQSRRLRPLRLRSAYPPIADMRADIVDGSDVPIAVIRRGGLRGHE